MNRSAKKTSRQKETARLDVLVSEFVRKRAIHRAGGCERCGTPKPDIEKDNGVFPGWKSLQWAHLWSRWHKSIRWDEDAAAGLCGGCHLLIDREPEEKLALRVKLLGERKAALVDVRSRTPGKPDVNGLTLYFRAMIKGLEAKA